MLAKKQGDLVLHNQSDLQMCLNMFMIEQSKVELVVVRIVEREEEKHQKDQH